VADAKTFIESELQRVAAMPQFAQLTYEEQQEARARIVATILNNDPALSQYDVQTKGKAIDQIVSGRAPVFEDPRKMAAAAPLIQKAQSGALEPTDISGFGAMHGLMSNGLAANIVGRPAAKIADMLTGSKENAAQFSWENLIDMHTGTDGDKLASYLESVGRKNGLRTVQKTYSGLGSAIGFVSDLYIFHGTYNKITAAPMKEAGVALAKKLPGKFGTWAGKVALPAFVSGTSSGAYGIVREQILATLNSDDERKQNTFRKIAKTFGEWALLDYAINISLGTVLPHLGGAIRRAGGKARETKKIKGMMPKELDDLIDRIVNGTVTDDMMGQLDDSTRRFLQGQAHIRVAASGTSRSIRLNPYDDLVLEGNSAGMTVHKEMGTSKYYVYAPTKGAGVTEEVFDDMVGARRRVSRGMYDKLKGLSGSDKDEYINLHKNMLQYEATSRVLDGGLDPLKVKGYVDPKRAEQLKKLRVKRASDFVSPIDRPYIGTGEADTMQKIFGDTGYVKVVKAEVGDEALGRVAKGQDMFSSKRPIRIKASTEGEDVLVMVRRPATPDAINIADRMAQKAVAKGAPESAEALRAMYLMEAGFDGIVESDDVVQMFYPDKLKLVASEFNPHTGKIGLAKNFVDESEATVRDTVSRMYKGTVSAKQFARNNKLVTAAAEGMKGELNQDQVQRFVRLVLADQDVPVNKISVKIGTKADVIDSADAMALARTASGGRITIEVPGRITTPKAQKQFIKELFDPESGQLKDVVEAFGGKGKKIAVPKMGKATSALYRSPFTSAGDTEKWLRSSVVDVAGGTFDKTAAGYQVKLPGRNPITGSNLEEITDRILLETTDFSYVKFDMARRGYNITKKGKVFTVRGKDLTEPITGKSVNEVADKIGYRPQKISNRFAPKVNMVSEDAVDITFENGVAIGNKRSVKQLLAKFEDMEHMTSLKKISGYDTGEVYVTPAGVYEVHMPEFGIIQKFETPTEANRFIRKSWKEYETLQSIGHRKGLQIWHEGAGLKVSDGQNTFTVKNKDELLRVYKEYPDSTGAPEIMLEEIDEEGLNAIDKVLREYDRANIPVHDGPPVRPLGDIAQKKGEPLTHMGATGEIRALFDNMDHWAEVTLNKMGQTDLLSKYRNITVTRRMAKAASDKAEGALRQIFTDDAGKMLPLERRKAIFYHSGAQTPAEELSALELFGELTEKEKGIAGRLRKLLGEDKDGVITGLAGVFGIGPDKMIKNYMPRIMDWAVKNADEVAKMSTAEDLVEAAMRDVYGTNPPKHLKAFFKNMRTSEALEFAAIDDPIRAVQHYIRVGYRQHYMGRAWEELYDTLAKSSVDEGVIQRFNRYREAIMGLHSNEGSRVAKRIGEDLGKKLGLKNGGNLVDAYFSMNYLANMGYRPWLALRNTYQVFTTLAPRFGNTWVDDAITKARSMTKEEYAYLREIGVLRGEPPIVNTILDAESTLGNITHKALGLFKSSDEYTRAVAYHTAAGRFDFALDKWRKGGIKDIDGFLKEAGITKMDSETISRVKALVGKNTDDGLNAARAYFGTKVSNETMFEYIKEQSPTIYTGSFFGKMFGQYGTYAAGYRANFMRGITNGDFGDKASFVARFVANQSALFAAFTALGIDAKNFIPGMPALFGGGPQFEVGVAVLQSMGSGYQARQARSQLVRKFSPVGYTKTQGLYANYPEMLPGSIQFRYAKKALEYYDQGDLWRAFLAATTTPVTDPKR